MEMANKVKRSGLEKVSQKPYRLCKTLVVVLPFSLCYSSSTVEYWVFRAALNLQTYVYFPPQVKPALNLQTYGYFPSIVEQYNFILDLSNIEFWEPVLFFQKDRNNAFYHSI